MKHLSDNDLVRQAMNAAMRAGTSNSGLVFDACASSDWGDMKAYAEEIKRRLAARKAARKPIPVIVPEGDDDEAPGEANQ